MTSLRLGGGLGTMDDNELVRSARAGDDDALSELLARYKTLARWLARSYFLPGSGQEDVDQEAMVGLFKAIRDFDLERDTPFRPFAVMCIRRHISTAVKGANRLVHRPLNEAISLDGLRSGESETGTPSAEVAIDRTPDIATLVASADLVERLRDRLDDMLTHLEREVLAMYIAGRSYEEMAEVFGNSLKSIDNALQRVKSKLRRHFNPDDAA